VFPRGTQREGSIANALSAGIVSARGDVLQPESTLRSALLRFPRCAIPTALAVDAPAALREPMASTNELGLRRPAAVAELGQQAWSAAQSPPAAIGRQV
jgi:hypothetical protein